MRIGLLADIHGNALALAAVLRDASRRGIDRWLNLGDVLYGPLWPRETFDLLQPLGAATIQGNHERDVYAATEESMRGNPTQAFVVESLGPEPAAWLRSLPWTLDLNDPGDSGIFACHGTPASDLVYLLEEVRSGGPDVRSEAEIVALLGGIHASLVVCGHSHVPRAVRLESGQLLVNPGSVGLPAYDAEHPNYHRSQTFSPDASYAVVERSDDGWHVEQLKVPYPHARAAEQARKVGRPDWAHWLATGRADGQIAKIA